MPTDLLQLLGRVHGGLGVAHRGNPDLETRIQPGELFQPVRPRPSEWEFHQLRQSVRQLTFVAQVALAGLLVVSTVISLILQQQLSLLSTQILEMGANAVLWSLIQ